MSSSRLRSPVLLSEGLRARRDMFCGVLATFSLLVLMYNALTEMQHKGQTSNYTQNDRVTIMNNRVFLLPLVLQNVSLKVSDSCVPHIISMSYRFSKIKIEIQGAKL